MLMSRLLIVLCITLCSCLSAFAQTWTGAAGTGLWATPGNWSTGTAPTTTSNVVFGDTGSAVTVNAGTLGEASTVKFSNPAGVRINVANSYLNNSGLVCPGGYSVTTPSSNYIGYLGMLYNQPS